MRKTLSIIVLFATLLTMSCEEDQEVNPFIGTWEVDTGVRFIFTQTYVTVYKSNGEKSWSGNYTYDETHITIHTDYREPVFEDLEIYPEPFVYLYEFRDIGLVIGMGLLVKIDDI